MHQNKSGAIGADVVGKVSDVNDSMNTIIKASSNDIGGFQDSFFFMQQDTDNSYFADRFEIEMYTKQGLDTSKFPSLHDWAKFGLMVRDSLDASSRHFSVFLTARKGVHIQYRTFDFSNSSIIKGDDLIRGGGWLKIERNGNMFRASYKNDPTYEAEETFYVMIGTTTIEMGENVRVGVALSSNNKLNTAEAEFSKFTLKVSFPALFASTNGASTNGMYFA